MYFSMCYVWPLGLQGGRRQNALLFQPCVWGFPLHRVSFASIQVVGYCLRFPTVCVHSWQHWFSSRTCWELCVLCAVVWWCLLHNEEGHLAFCMPSSLASMSQFWQFFCGMARWSTDSSNRGGLLLPVHFDGGYTGWEMSSKGEGKLCGGDMMPSTEALGF